MRWIWITVLVSAACGCRMLAPAGSGATTAAHLEPGSMAPETKILSRLHEIDQRQIRLGQLAEAKASAAQVRRYAERLVRDHQASDERVEALARRKGITLVELRPEIDEQRWQAAEREEVWRQLDICQGQQFDLAFLPVAKRWHGRDLKQLMADELQLTDHDVKGLVKKLLPILGQHETLADHVNWSVRAEQRARRE